MRKGGIIKPLGSEKLPYYGTLIVGACISLITVDIAINYGSFALLFIVSLIPAAVKLLLEYYNFHLFDLHYNYFNEYAFDAVFIFIYLFLMPAVLFIILCVSMGVAGIIQIVSQSAGLKYIVIDGIYALILLIYWFFFVSKPAYVIDCWLIMEPLGSCAGNQE